jgi:hypothetical protein
MSENLWQDPPKAAKFSKTYTKYPPCLEQLRLLFQEELTKGSVLYLEPSEVPKQLLFIGSRLSMLGDEAAT